MLGLIAAAYSSADSALTSLTTSFCVDFLGFGKSEKSEKEKQRTRLMVHVGFSILLFFVILIFHALSGDAVINVVLSIAGLTYGPLLGLYSFGLLTNRQVNDELVIPICLISPLLAYLLDTYSADLLGGFQFGFLTLAINGLFTFLGLLLSSSPAEISE